MQAAMLGFMGLVLAFGLSLAVGRYEDRRAAVVNESNAIGTAYLRAQTLPEPARTRSLDLLRQYTDTSIRIANTVPASGEQDAAIADSRRTERALWGEAGGLSTPNPPPARHACTSRASTRPLMLSRAASTASTTGCPRRSWSSRSLARRSPWGCSRSTSPPSAVA